METKHDIRKALLVADGGSTKTDWCLTVSHQGPQLFRTRGLNPALLELPAIREILQTELLPRLTPHLQDPEAETVTELLDEYHGVDEQEIRRLEVTQIDIYKVR